jgi:hypothetical protein
MNKILIVPLLVVSIISIGNISIAQSDVEFGAKAGINIASTNDYNSSSLLGFIGGGFLTYHLTDIFSVQPEILFTMKGEKLNETIPSYGIVHSEIRFNYIEVPLLGKVTIPGMLSPNLFVGPFFSIFPENFKRTDFGLAIGGGADFDITQFKIILDIRYSFSLKDAANITTTLSDLSGNIFYENSRDVKNKVFSIMIGISF